MTSALPTVQPYDIGCEPSSSGPAETVIADGWCTYLLFFAVSKQLNANGYLDDLRVAVLHCEHCVMSKFGYPNDEGFPEHPLYEIGLDESGSSVLEIVDSHWTVEVTDQLEASARRIHGDRYEESWSSRPDLRHFIVALHEKTFECIAKSMTVELFTETFESAIAHVHGKMSEH